MTPKILARYGAIYAVVTALQGWRLLASPATTIAQDAGDPMLNAAILTWNAITLPWTDRWYDMPIYYPAADAITFSEHLLGGSVLATPLYWLTQNGVAAYNLTLLLSYPLSALAMFLLVWRLTRNELAAFLAGAAFGFAPYRAAQLPHIQVLLVFWAPLALLGLHAYFETRRRRWLALFGACWMLQGAANGYFLVFFSVLVGLWLAWFGIARRRWGDVAAAAATMIVAALPLVPILYRYWVAHHRYGFMRGADEIRFFSGALTAPACPAEGLTLWGWLGSNCGPEGELFVGPVLAVLVIAGLWLAVRTGGPRAGNPRLERALKYASRAAMALSIPFLAGGIAFVIGGPWRVALGPIEMTASSAVKPFTNGVLLLLAGFLSSRFLRTLVQRSDAAAFYLLAALVCWAFTWGLAPRIQSVDVLPTSPYVWLSLLPGLDGLRVPTRFWMMAVLCLCVLLGLVLAPWLQRLSGRRLAAVATVMAVGLLADGWMFIPAAQIPQPPPDPEALRGKTVMTLPIVREDFTAQYRAVAGGWRSVNGASGYHPTHYESLRYASAQETDDLFAPFAQEELHVLVAEDAPRLITAVERQPGVQEVVRRGYWRHYRIPSRHDPLLSEPAGTPLPIASLSATCREDDLAFTRDGDLATRWHCGAQTRDHEVRVDLGSPRSVGAVVTALGEFPRDFPRHLIIDTSVDGESWQPAWDGPVQPAAVAAAFRDPERIPMSVSFAPRAARYVRLRNTGRDEDWWWSIAEIEVRSPDGRN